MGLCTPWPKSLNPIQLHPMTIKESPNHQVWAQSTYIFSICLCPRPYQIDAITNAPLSRPDLLNDLLYIIPGAIDGQLHGGLKVLEKLVEDSLTDDTFFPVMPQVTKILFNVAGN
ncbi:ARM repeat-containing protein [Curvularia clavata]|uniref:ARM repeat-containing protein n=1 Tax=Curvularia clavata TaxID=95742 RepID=A0A9Q8Z209_CURCL|nr:ARM repeat-containing protein [Curvularia clavata]